MNNSQKTKDFWEWLNIFYAFKVVQKKNSKLMKFIGWFLSLIKVVDKQKFMNNFTTTIGNTIYIPFEIGEGTEEELWAQIKVGVHETIHINQEQLNGKFKYIFGYLFLKNARVKYEAEAYRSGMVLDWHKFKSYSSPIFIVESLRSYNLKSKQISWAQRYLEKSEEGIKRGVRFHMVTTDVIDWLDEYDY